MYKFFIYKQNTDCVYEDLAKIVYSLINYILPRSKKLILSERSRKIGAYFWERIQVFNI